MNEYHCNLRSEFLKVVYVKTALFSGVTLHGSEEEYQPFAGTCYHDVKISIMTKDIGLTSSQQIFSVVLNKELPTHTLFINRIINCMATK
jgi:hypothetical protein